jgi:hypothetical protein
MSRLGVTSKEFYQLTPVELHWALKDHETMHFTPMKRTCEMLRMVAQITHNSTQGLEKKDMIDDVRDLVEFPWEEAKKVRVQTVQEMKSYILGLSHLKEVDVSQENKSVEDN